MFYRDIIYRNTIFWPVLNLYYLLSVSFYFSYIFSSFMSFLFSGFFFFCLSQLVNKCFICVQSPFSFEIYFEILIFLFHYFPFQSSIHSLFYFTLHFAHPVLFFKFLIQMLIWVHILLFGKSIYTYLLVC